MPKKKKLVYHLNRVRNKWQNKVKDVRGGITSESAVSDESSDVLNQAFIDLSEPGATTTRSTGSSTSTLAATATPPSTAMSTSKSNPPRPTTTSHPSTSTCTSKVAKPLNQPIQQRQL